MSADLAEQAADLDLEEFRRAQGLSYRQLAELLGSSHASKTRDWAIGAARPEADQMEYIVQRTGGVVTVDAMHRRRLQWLRENEKISVPLTSDAQGGESGDREGCEEE